MKTLASQLHIYPAVLLLISTCASGLQAAAGRDDLPPGLQKKDRLPPGWQKKQAGKGKKEAVVRTSTATNAPAATSKPTPPAVDTTSTGNGAAKTSPVDAAPKSVGTESPASVVKAAPSTPAANPVATRPLTKEQRENLARMERALGDIEREAERPGASDRLMHRLSNRHGVSLTTLQAQLKRNQGVTVGELYLAHLIAKERRIAAEQILKERQAGTPWSDVVRSHKVQFADMAERLRAAADAAKEAANAEQNRIEREEKRK